MFLVTVLASAEVSDVTVTPELVQIGKKIILTSNTDQRVHLHGAAGYMVFNLRLKAGVAKELLIPTVTPKIKGIQEGGKPIVDGASIVIWNCEKSDKWPTVGMFKIGRVTATSLGTQDLPGPREPLSFRNFGTYCSYPLDYGILQVRSTSQPESLPRLDKRIKKARTRGVRIIAEIEVFTHEDRTKMNRFKKPAPLEVFEKRVDTFFAYLDPADLYAVTLDEERGYWGGQQEILNHLYDYVKSKYDVPVYQWYSPSAAAPGFGYPVLKADGWVSDDYWREGKDFEQFVRKYLVHGKPFLHLCWAAPDFPQKSYKGFHTFWEQLAVCRKYNIPISFFCYVPRTKERRDCWAWEGIAPSKSKEMWQTILEEQRKAKTIPEKELYAHWDEVEPARPVELTFDKTGRVWYEDDFTTDYSTKPAYFMDDATIFGFRDLVWNDNKELALRATENGARKVSLIYHFVSLFEMSNLSVQLKAKAKNKQATNKIEVSRDGKKWLSEERIRSFRNLKEFWVRLVMETKEAQKGEITNTLNFFRVEGQLTPPTKKEISLVPDKKGKIEYIDEFKSPRHLLLASVDNPADLEWRKGFLGTHGVKGYAVKVSVRYKFVSNKPVSKIRIRMQSSADEKDFAARNYLTVIPTGQNKEFKVGTEGRFRNDWLEIDLSREKISPLQKFWVVLTMVSNSGAQTRTTNRITRLEIKAEE